MTSYKGSATNDYQGSTRATPQLAVRIICWVILGVVAVFNFQPWFDLGVYAATQINIIPFYDTIRAIPVIGGLFAWFVGNLAGILAVGLWWIVQRTQVASMFTQIDRKSYPELWFKQQITKWGAYGIEIIICFLASPPYTGGWSSLKVDLPIINFALIDWNAVVTFLLFLGAFEATCGLMDWALGWNPVSGRSR